VSEQPIDPIAFVSGAQLAKRMGITPDVLYGASNSKQFARYYLFGKRKYYRLAEVEKALVELVPGDPDRWWKVAESIDAACKSRPRTVRRPGARGARRGGGL
jgi:hypothetical protein